MPVFNSELYLSQAIESILNQTYKEIELIVVNDGSTDNSKQIIKSYNDPRIKYFEHSVNRGIVKTRNECIANSNGKYIAYLDSDDFAYSSRIEKQVNFLETHKEIGLCGSYYEMVNEKGKILTRYRVPLKDIEIRTHLLLNNCIANSSVMVRTELVKELEYLESYEMAEDYFLWYRLSKITKTANLPSYLLQYRVHGANVSIKKSETMLRCRKTIDKAILEDLAIPHTDTELNIHSNFILGNFKFFNTNEKQKSLELWLIQFYHYINGKPEYDINTVKRIFTLRWLSMIYENKMNISKVPFSNISKEFNFQYIRFCFEYITHKFRLTNKVF